MPVKLEGDLVVRDANIAIVVARFNDLFPSKLLEGATDPRSDGAVAAR